MKELQKQLAKEERLQSPQFSEAMLIRLADICSHTAQGLRFLAQFGDDLPCDIFYATSPTSGTLRQVNYDIKMHQSSMKHLSNMASSLEGSGWKKLGNISFALAGLMLVACGILAAVPTGGAGLLLGLGSTAILTAGFGFFVRKDTELVNAVRNAHVNMAP